MKESRVMMYLRDAYEKNMPCVVWFSSPLYGSESCGRVRLGKFEAYTERVETRKAGIYKNKPVMVRHTSRQIYRVLRNLAYGARIYMYLEPLEKEEADDFRMTFPYATEVSKGEVVD